MIRLMNAVSLRFSSGLAFFRTGSSGYPKKKIGLLYTHYYHKLLSSPIG